MLTRYIALFGDPADGNPTSKMQNAAFEHAGLDWRYIDLTVKATDLEAAMGAARMFGFSGLNLTVPHKVAVLPLLDGLEPSAEISGACNTVVRQEDGRFIGSNTDGTGFVWSLRDADIDPAGLDVVLLGAGGAARAVSVELALAAPGTSRWSTAMLRNVTRSSSCSGRALRSAPRRCPGTASSRFRTAMSWSTARRSGWVRVRQPWRWSR